MRHKALTATVAGMMLLTAGLLFLYRNALTQPIVPENRVFEIAKGDSFKQIVHNLNLQGIKINPFWFRCYALQKNYHNKLKAGEYELTSGMNVAQILTIFAEGKVKKYAITIPEGFNLKEVLQLIANHPNLIKTIINKDEIRDKMGITQQNPEGWFFPDTYYFEKNDTDLSILKRAYNKMKLVLQDEWLHKAPNLPFKSEYEALIMASIVEKENGVKSERAMIAGVFTRRLEQGMMLQTDPTVIYGMGDDYRGNIRAKDLKAKTAYNTYVINGLPPTPIAMPGRDAIHAALHPDSAKNLYFVAKGNGTHHFSGTLSDHNKAVITFQLHRNGH